MMIILCTQLFCKSNCIFQISASFLQRKCFYGIVPNFIPLFIPCKSQWVHYPDLTNTVAADMAAVPETAVSFIRKERSAAEGTKTLLYCLNVRHFHRSFVSVDIEYISGIDEGQGRLYEQTAFRAFLQLFHIT